MRVLLYPSQPLGAYSTDHKEYSATAHTPMGIAPKSHNIPSTTHIGSSKDRSHLLFRLVLSSHAYLSIISPIVRRPPNVSITEPSGRRNTSRTWFRSIR